MKIEFPLIGYILKPLAKSILIPLALTAAASATDAAIHKKMFRSSATALVISNQKKKNDIIKIIKSPVESGLLIKGIREAIKNETKEQKGGFLAMLLGTLVSNLLTVKGTRISCCLILYQILKYKSVIKMNLNLMVFLR